MARAGFGFSGVLHLLVGYIALKLAFGAGGEADQGGAMSTLAAQPAGPFILWFGFVTCAALALWQLSEAVFSYGHLETAKKVGKRISAVSQAAVYAVIALTFAAFAVGKGKDSGEATSDWTVLIMKAPFGRVILVAIGLGIVVAGIVFVVRGVLRSFTKVLDLPPAHVARTAIKTLGVVGYVAKGIAVFLVGLLFIVATLQSEPEESTGLDGSLKALREQPFGEYLLAFTGGGLICYGLYQMVKSRYAKM